MLHPAAVGGAARAGPAALRTSKDAFGGSGAGVPIPPALESNERRADGSSPATRMAPDSRGAAAAVDQQGGGRSYNNGGGSGGSMFSSTARSDQRMARYFRPIAPKPPAPKPGESAGSAPSDPQSSSTLSFERTNAKSTSVSSEVSRGKRTRRRIGVADSLPSLRRAKRGSAAGAPAARLVIRPDKPRTVSCKSTAVIGGIEKAVEQFAPDKPGLYHYQPQQQQQQHQQYQVHQLQQLRPVVPASEPFLPMKMEGPSNPHGLEVPPMDMRLGFTPPPLPTAMPRFDRRKFGPGFGALAMKQPPRHWVKDNMSGCNLDGSVDLTFRESNEKEHQQHVVPDLSFGISNAVSEVVSDADSRKTNLVTLSLLPDTPSQGYISLESSIPNTAKSSKLPFLPLAMGIDLKSWEAEEDVGRKENEQSRGGCSSSEYQSQQVMDARPLLTLGRSTGNPVDERMELQPPSWAASVVDSRQLERDYACVPDPMILMDEADKCVLWTNQAFKRAENERNNGKAKAIGAPYLDPLGIRTQLCSYTYQPLQGPRIKAILWNFLKKFVMADANGECSHSLTDGKGVADNRQRTPERQYSNMIDLQEQHFQESLQISHPFTPRPVRPVGSTLTVMSVENSIGRPSTPFRGTLDSVKEQLDGAAMPIVITDQRNRVMWVNAAYKQLVGQPECSWLASTVGKKAATVKDNSQHSRLTGEVVLKCHQPLAQRLSCRVHLQWMNQGEEMSTQVPCEVTRIENDGCEHLYVWKLMSGP